jgi:N-acetylglucosaminyldiphosphoundecaprenol N-acetyl-beta-D-mannosaminyltransferase
MIRFGDFEIFSGDVRNGLHILFGPNSSESMHFHFLAASSVVSALGDRRLLDVYNHGVSIADSRPLAFIMHMLKFKVENIRGTDFMRAAISHDAGTLRHWFIGSSLESIESCIAAVIEINSSFQVAGHLIPEFKDSFEDDFSDWFSKISDAHSDVVWIGISSPKQDFVAFELSTRYRIKTIAVGAAFNFIGGNIQEAPSFLRKLGLEWFFRLISEPRRLWKRYLIGNAKFLWYMIKIAISVQRR